MRTNVMVSVLIPTYNSASFLDEAIQSVLDQTYTDFELIIVDNQSTDNTEELVSKYLHDHRVKYIKNDTNIGVVGNFNRCLELASGKYIKYLMSDDKFHPQILEKFVSVMEEHPNVSLVTSDRGVFGEINYTWVLPFHHQQPGKKVIYDSLGSCNWIGEPSTVMFRRSNLHLGKFKSDYKYLIDWDMWLRHLSVGDCYIVPGALSFFRIHANQVTRQVLSNIHNYIEEYKFYNALRRNNEYGIDFNEFNPEKLIKVRALFCAKVILKAIMSRKLKKNWTLMQEALRIIRQEKVPIHLYPKLFSKKRLSEIY